MVITFATIIINIELSLYSSYLLLGSVNLFQNKHYVVFHVEVIHFNTM